MREKVYLSPQARAQGHGRHGDAREGYERKALDRLRLRFPSEQASSPRPAVRPRVDYEGNRTRTMSASSFTARDLLDCARRGLVTLACTCCAGAAANRAPDSAPNGHSGGAPNSRVQGLVPNLSPPAGISQYNTVPIEISDNAVCPADCRNGGLDATENRCSSEHGFQASLRSAKTKLVRPTRERRRIMTDVDGSRVRKAAHVVVPAQTDSRAAPTARGAGTIQAHQSLKGKTLPRPVHRVVSYPYLAQSGLPITPCRPRRDAAHPYA